LLLRQAPLPVRPAERIRRRPAGWSPTWGFERHGLPPYLMSRRLACNRRL
jgi:hypothetical protein